uniref:Uncharacterized protein n=1 Tax=Arundo donax TaxID=35708 RepID=A0A0A9D3X6_ARUDO
MIRNKPIKTWPILEQSEEVGDRNLHVLFWEPSLVNRTGHGPRPYTGDLVPALILAAAKLLAAPRARASSRHAVFHHLAAHPLSARAAFHRLGAPWPPSHISGRTGQRSHSSQNDQIFFL